MPRTHLIESLEPRRLFSSGLPRPDHIVIVVEENRDYHDILGTGTTPPILWTVVPPSQLSMTPYIRKLANQSASLTNMFAETHPSQPNYLALFSGSSQGVAGDTPPSSQFTAPSLGGQLIASGLSFAGYSEDQPSAGYLGEKSGEYARKHNPWSDFTDVPASSNLPFSDFPTDFTKLPTVSFVVPNQIHDMHSDSPRAGDNWLKANMSAYINWTRAHNSLFILTFDEGRSGNHIPTFVFGAGARKGKFQLAGDHYRLLRTIEQMYGLTPLANAANRAPLRRLFTASLHMTTSSFSPATAQQPVFSEHPVAADSAWRKLAEDPAV
jgi:phosphatidylinositol-3-phosphatase